MGLSEIDIDARVRHPGERARRARARHVQHWRQEMDGAALFGGLAAMERVPRRRRAYQRLADVEARHAERFALELARASVQLPHFTPTWRTRLLLALARRFGTVSVLPRIALLERADARGYRLDDPDLAPYDEEHANALWLAEFAAFEAGEALKRLLLRGRRSVILVLGATLFAISIALARNAQLEGLFFGLLGGVLVGPVTHYLLAKGVFALAAGRVWCGWACWTAALLDQLPYRASPGWLPGRARSARFVAFSATLVLVLALALGFGYGGGSVGPDAAAWFVVGNALYWLAGIALAVALRDNRAFCKYACPVSVLLRLSTRPALVKVAGDPTSCTACVSQACLSQCPMSIGIPDYVVAGKRLLASECIMCLHCVAVCPPNTLRLSVGLDLGGVDALRERVDPVSVDPVSAGSVSVGSASADPMLSARRPGRLVRPSASPRAR